MTAENKDTRTTNPATASNNKKKFNIIPISILVAVLIAGSFAVIFSRNVKSEDVLPKVDANNLEVIKTKVPNIDDSLGWLNTEGISQEKINSSVVIYDFGPILVSIVKEHFHTYAQYMTAMKKTASLFLVFILLNLILRKYILMLKKLQKNIRLIGRYYLMTI